MTPSNILILRTDRIGDVILSTPVATALKRRYPEAKVSMMVRPYTQEILQGHPDIDEILVYDPEGEHKGGGGFLRLLGEIKERKFDLALVLHPHLRLALLLFFARVKIRIGTGYRFYSFLFNRRVYEHRKLAQKHELEYNMDVAQKAGADPREVKFKFFIPEEAKRKVNSILKTFGIADGERFIILHPGSGGSARDWPLENFSQLAKKMISELGVHVIITGERGEKSLIDRIMRPPKAKLHRCDGQLTLKELAALIQRADLVISNSTGPMHLAVALGREVLAFFCPIIPCSPKRWGPYKREDSVLLPNVPPCKKCIGEKCPYYDCMRKISVDQAFETVRRKLDQEERIQ